MVYNYVQTNNYHKIGIVSLNHMIVYRLFVSGRNTWNHATVYKWMIIGK